MIIKPQHYFAYFNSNIKVQWKREYDNQQIQQYLTVSDYDFLIRRKRGLMLLKPISELTTEVVPGFSELEMIVQEMEDVCDAYIKWVLIWQKKQEVKRLVQAPYEVFEILLQQGYDVFGLIPENLALNVNEFSH